MATIKSIPEDSDRGWVPSILDDFGARLALVRHRMGWNVKEAALACGLPAASWRGWEMHGMMPRDFLSAVNKIADQSGCDIVWLAGFPVTAQQDQAAWDWPSGKNPRPEEDPDGGLVRHQGLEPRTRWLNVAADYTPPPLLEAS